MRSDGLATASVELERRRPHDAVTHAKPDAERSVIRQRDADRGMGLVDLVAPGAMVAVVAGARRSARSIRRVQQALFERTLLTGRAPPAFA